MKKASPNTTGRRSVCPAMTESIPKLVRGDVVEWPEWRALKVGERFRVEGLPTLLRATDGFRVTSIGVNAPD